MTEFTLGAYRLQADVETTRAYYAACPQPWVTCDCAGCRNFARAVRFLPPAVAAFFASLGLDPEKPAEIYALDQEDSAVCLYGGFYHLTGKLTAGVPAPGYACGTWLELAEGFSAAFRPDCALLPVDFPQPCLQMEVNFRFPWLLEEENAYYHNNC